MVVAVIATSAAAAKAGCVKILGVGMALCGSDSSGSGCSNMT